MQGVSDEFKEIIAAGAFIGPLTKKDQDFRDLLNAFTLFDDNGLIPPDAWERDEPEGAP